MLEFYQQLATTLKQGAVVVATVTSIKGSVPREVGAKMFITADGKSYGTIGGGAGEAKVHQQAWQIFQTGEKQFVQIDLSGTAQRQAEGICGGTMLVWLELWLGSESMNLANQIIEILSSGRSGAIITPFHPEEKPYLETAYTPNCPLLKNHALIEPLLPPPTLLISGAGHIAIPLAKIAKIAGFQIIVQDDRPEYATSERFPDATLLVTEPINSIQENIQKIPNLYVALVTRGYIQDLPALHLFCNLRVQYIGMVGSNHRIKTVFKMLRQEGISPELLHSIYAPIGLDIGALTPEEIAVSICAELIKVRRGGTGVSLSEKM